VDLLNLEYGFMPHDSVASTRALKEYLGLWVYRYRASA